MVAIEAFMREQIAHGTPGNLEAYMQHMRADHTPPEEVGRLAAEAGVKTLVLAHIAPPAVTDEQWRAAAAKYFKGQIIVGHDMMVV
jgi:ribonuclease BN (tRNA processing enzyme)